MNDEQINALRKISQRSHEHNVTSNSSNDKVNKLPGYYREAIFIMFGIVMTYNFFHMAPQLFNGVDMYLTSRWLFVNVIILSSWMGYMQFVSNQNYKYGINSKIAFLFDIAILFEYYLLIQIVNEDTFSEQSLKNMYYIFIAIFSTYIFWDFCWVGKEKIKTPFKLHSNIALSIIFLAIIIIHFLSYDIFINYCTQITCIHYDDPESTIDWDKWSNTAKVFSLTAIVILFRLVKIFNK